MSIICVSVGRGRHRHLIAEHQHLAQQGAKLVELRLDCLQTNPNLARLMAEKPCPIIVTVRRLKDGGHWQRSEGDRVMLLRQAIAAGVDYVDLEEDIAASIPRFGKTKRIVSLHNFQETPKDLAEIHARLSTLNADIVKIATMANSPLDNIAMLQLVKNAKVPTVGICMGDMGTPTRILTGKFGSPFSFATFHAERTLAPGQLTFETMKDVYNYEQINAETEVYGVIADPVGHSLSPLIHNGGFHSHKLNKVYVPFRVPREALGPFISQCGKLGIQGLSVTIPHKEEILKYLKKTDDATKAIGACNTVVFKDGESLGFNTDYTAAMAAIDKVFGGTEAAHGLAGKIALVLGAGGVSRAIAWGLKRRGVDVVITSRTSERADELAKKLDCRTVSWAMRHSLVPRLIVNGTPVGMHPNVNETPYEAHYLRDGVVVFDTVYNPEQTLLIKNARDVDCPTITGVDMFVGQAALQFRHFTGTDLDQEPLRGVVRRAINAARI